MFLKLKTRKTNSSNIVGLITKIILMIVVFSGVVYFLNQIEMPSPNKLIKKQIPNEKIITLK